MKTNTYLRFANILPSHIQEQEGKLVARFSSKISFLSSIKEAKKIRSRGDVTVVLTECETVGSTGRHPMNTGTHFDNYITNVCTVKLATPRSVDIYDAWKENISGQKHTIEQAKAIVKRLRS